ncbi:MAG TPA: type I-E CRISPR-associated endonuclease Cas1e [Sedimentisphaerales bacterium]|nr:type I-E CRISPR-associated endonuclease Cas1e [Sedimentisphaerales bacterium]
MKKRINLQELPRFSDKLSYLYVDKAVIEQEAKSIALWQEDGITSVPAASLAVLLLGPGTKITHEAVKTLADNNCLIAWCGEDAVRFYAAGCGGTRSARNLLVQARLVTNEVTRLQVVVRMYCIRFADPPDAGLTLEQLRGMEGIRVRQAYAEAAKAAGIEWQGRSYKRQKWEAADPVNRALSAGNACLYGLVHAAVISGGYSPALGFVHTGKHLSFVYDIADLYKVEHIIPVAFNLAKADPPQLEREVRMECRRQFKAARLMERILPDISRVLDVPVAAEEQLIEEFAGDESRPSDWWQPATLKADMPIGQILKLQTVLRDLQKENKDGGDDPGAGEPVAAG